MSQLLIALGVVVVITLVFVVIFGERQEPRHAHKWTKMIDRTSIGSHMDFTYHEFATPFYECACGKKVWYDVLVDIPIGDPRTAHHFWKEYRPRGRTEKAVTPHKNPTGMKDGTD